MKKYGVPALYALPAVLAGTYIMYLHGISAAIYLQNVLYVAVAGLLSTGYGMGSCKPGYKIVLPAAVASVLFLCIPFLQEGIGGIHRWIRLGPISLNAAFLSVPILLILIDRMLQKGNVKSGVILSMVAAAVLFLQPDASMVTAFSAALLPIFSRSSANRFSKCLFVILLILSGLSWIDVENPEPVSYVEDVLVLAWKSGWGCLVLCVAALLFLLVPFGKWCGKTWKSPVSPALGLFFLVLILSTLIGAFPVPVIGYGISPIAGYVLSVSCLKKAEIQRGDGCREEKENEEGNTPL